MPVETILEGEFGPHVCFRKKAWGTLSEPRGLFLLARALMSILGLDIGEKRIGVAASDELLFMAHPVGMIEHTSKKDTLQQIKRIVDDYKAQKIVVGLPKTMKGEIGTKAEEILKFVEFLKPRLACEIVTWDERFTTVQAERKLLEHDVSRAKRREKRDQLAAEFMLQSYLDYLKGTV